MAFCPEFKLRTVGAVRATEALNITSNDLLKYGVMDTIALRIRAQTF